MKYTVIDDDPVSIRSLLGGAAELYRVIDSRNVILGVMEAGTIDEDKAVAVVMAKRDVGAAAEGYTVATIEAKPRLIRIHPEPLGVQMLRPEHKPEYGDHHPNGDGMMCVCTRPCCNTDDGELCTCPPCTDEHHQHADR